MKEGLGVNFIFYCSIKYIQNCDHNFYITNINSEYGLIDRIDYETIHVSRLKGTGYLIFIG